MKRFAILRDVAPDTDWEALDSAAIQNLINMTFPEFFVDRAWDRTLPQKVSWIRTYWEQGSNWGTCLYEAPDEQAVRDWHELCFVPYAGIREVEVEEDTMLAEYPRGFHQPADKAPLVVVESASAPETAQGYRFIRTYRFADTGEEMQLFLAPAGTESAPPAGRVVRRVVEIRPEDYQ